MLVQNLETVDRRFEGFTADESDGSINISGEYVVKVKNIGKAPAPRSTVKVISLSLDAENELIAEKSKSISRMSPGESKEVSFTFSKDIKDSRSTAVRGCEGNAISISSEEAITGLLFIKRLEVSGGVDVSSGECSLEQPELDPVQPGPGPEVPEPEPEPAPQPEPEPDDGDDEQEGNDGDNQQDDTQNEEQTQEDIEIQQLNVNGPAAVMLDTTQEYSLQNPPDNTETYAWDSSASESRTVSENAYSVTFSDVSNEVVGGAAANSDGNIIAQGEKEVVVISPDAENARDNESEISGRRFVPTNETATYSWSDFPDNTIGFAQQVSSSEEFEGNVNSELTSLNRTRVQMEFSSDTSGNFLVAIAALDSNQQVIEQVQMPVTALRLE
jgi:hypothetical protein